MTITEVAWLREYREGRYRRAAELLYSQQVNATLRRAVVASSELKFQPLVSSTASGWRKLSVEVSAAGQFNGGLAPTARRTHLNILEIINS